MESPAATHDAIFDQVMESVGDNGPFQWRFNYIYNIGLVFCASLVYNNMLFALSTPDHWCHVPGRENTNYTMEEWKNLTLPRKLDNRGISSYSQCQMYNVSIAVVDDWDYENPNFGGLNVVDCMHGYEYDKQWYESTAVSQENWVCGKELYRTNTFAFSRIGEVFGTFLFGQLGDTLGRKLIYYVSVLMLLGGRVATIFSAPWYTLFVIAATFGSLTANSVFQSPLIIAMETSKPEKRALIAMLQNLAWATAMCVMPLICWVLRDWTTFLWVSSLPMGVFLFFPKYMIESPRWLASVGKLDKCAKYLLDIARINGKTVDITEISLKKMLPDHNKADRVYGMLSFFIGWRIAMNTLLLVSCWVVCAVSYFTLLLSVAELPGNPFLNFLLQSLLEFPSFFVGQYFSNAIGRRLTNAASFAVAGVLSAVLILIVNNLQLQVYTICLTIVVKFCVSITFFAVYLQSMETYPTCLRQTGISLGMVASNAFGAVGPYIVYLGSNYDQRYPYIILCGLFLVGTVCGLFTPETLHTKLPDTLEDALKFGVDQKFWSIPRPPIPDKKAIGYDVEGDETVELNQPQFAP